MRLQLLRKRSEKSGQQFVNVFFFVNILTVTYCSQNPKTPLKLIFKSRFGRELDLILMLEEVERKILEGHVRSLLIDDFHSLIEHRQHSLQQVFFV